MDENGVVTGVSYGTTVIRASTSSGLTANLAVSVLGAKRRMFIAYFFGLEEDAGYLPFAKNNAESMYETFSDAVVEGQRYDIAGPYCDLTKAQLFSRMSNHFRDASDEDVSLIYICAHGYEKFGLNQEYAFALDRTHFVFASELMSQLEAIPGKVVVIMDSCHSAGLIETNSDRLIAQNGRISIRAATQRPVSGSYWDVPNPLQSVDYFTYALLKGLGYNEADGIGGSARGWLSWTSDADADGDGRVTVKELFDYAKALTVKLVTVYKDYTQFRGDPTQTPTSFFGTLMNLILFARQ